MWPSSRTKRITVTLSNASAAGVPANPATGTIINDDIPPDPAANPAAVPLVHGDGSGRGGGPHVRVIDSVTRQERFGFFAYAMNFTGGVHVATGDVNGDGIDDIITAPGRGGGPHVRIFNGETGTVFPGAAGSFMAFETSYTGGVYVAAGDINFDGRAEIFVATETPTGGVGEAGSPASACSTAPPAACCGSSPSAAARRWPPASAWPWATSTATAASEIIASARRRTHPRARSAHRRHPAGLHALSRASTARSSSPPAI